MSQIRWEKYQIHEKCQKRGNKLAKFQNCDFLTGDKSFNNVAGNVFWGSVSVVFMMSDRTQLLVEIVTSLQNAIYVSEMIGKI